MVQYPPQKGTKVRIFDLTNNMLYEGTIEAPTREDAVYTTYTITQRDGSSNCINIEGVHLIEYEDSILKINKINLWKPFDIV